MATETLVAIALRSFHTVCTVSDAGIIGRSRQRSMQLSRAGFDMLLGALYLLIEGARAWSVDARVACDSGTR